MKKPIYFLILFVVAGLVACEAPAPKETINMDEVRAQIESLEKEYAAAINADDVEAQMNYYADDAHTLPPGKPTVKGKKAIMEMAKEEQEEEGSDGGKISFETVDLYAAGDYAVEVGEYVWTDSTGKEYVGKYMGLFEKQEDGQYKCIRDIWNANEKYGQTEESGDEADTEETEEDGEE